MTPIEFLKAKSNNPYTENIFPKPTDYSEAVDILVEHFLGKDWYCTGSIHAGQVTTEEVGEIITRYESYKFRHYPWWKRIYLKIYCAFKGIPIYSYY